MKMRFRYPMWLEVRKKNGMSEPELRRERQAFKDGWNAHAAAVERMKASLPEMCMCDGSIHPMGIGCS